MPLNEWVTDDISVGDGDQTDWKALDLAAPGLVTVEFAADEKDAGVKVAVFDRYGELMGGVKRPKGSSSPVKFHVKALKSGRHFLAIKAETGPTSAYSVRVNTEDGGSGGDTDTGRPDF